MRGKLNSKALSSSHLLYKDFIKKKVKQRGDRQVFFLAVLLFSEIMIWRDAKSKGSATNCFTLY
jgi:hypothetical protein